MPDDQDQKPTTIDDLVKQLSNQGGQKPPFSPQPSSEQAGSPGLSFSNKIGAGQPPSNLPGIKVESKPLTPPVPSVPPVRPPSPPPPVGVPKPSISPSAGVAPQPPRPPQPQPPQPSPVQPPKQSPLQEYRSSIRTMSEDISSIQAGQKPSGMDIPRKIGPEQPKVEPEIKKPTTPPVSISSKPSVELGKAEQAKPLPFSPPPMAKKQEMPKPPEMQPSIKVPGGKKMFVGLRPISYMLIAGVLVVGGLLYWFFIWRAVEPEVVVSPTPSPILTPTPSPAKSLSEIFEGTSVDFEVSPSANLGQDFKKFITTLDVAGSEFLKVNLSENKEGTLIPLNFFDMFDVALTAYPSELRMNTADSAVLAYGQKETFNTDGTINFTGQGLKKTVFVVRIKGGTETKTAMNSWEPTIADDLADYLQINDVVEASTNFLDNTYRGVSIRYKNFPFPDVAVDYSIIETDGQGYLVISGSRESTYAAIDALLGQ